ncbi:hypothetical protein ACFL6Y_02165 [Elusimicrobiota bacterium]
MKKLLIILIASVSCANAFEYQSAHILKTNNTTALFNAQTAFSPLSNFKPDAQQIKPLINEVAYVGQNKRRDLATILTSRIVYRGRYEQALQNAKSIIWEMAINLPMQMLEELESEQFTAYIIPANRDLTDLPELADLKGEPTSDGRAFNRVRGCARRVNGIEIVFAEEDVVPFDIPGAKHKTVRKHFGLIAAHEMAHAVHYVVSWEGHQELIDAYESRVNNSLPFPGNYASKNMVEYFAVSASMFFGTRDHAGKRGLDWLRSNDNKLLSILTKIFGDPKNLSLGINPRSIEPDSAYIDIDEDVDY